MEKFCLFTITNRFNIKFHDGIHVSWNFGEERPEAPVLTTVSNQHGPNRWGGAYLAPWCWFRLQTKQQLTQTLAFLREDLQNVHPRAPATSQYNISLQRWWFCARRGCWRRERSKLRPRQGLLRRKCRRRRASLRYSRRSIRWWASLRLFQRGHLIEKQKQIWLNIVVTGKQNFFKWCCKFLNHHMYRNVTFFTLY